VNYTAYLNQVRDRLVQRGFQPISGVDGPFGLLAQRSEAWGSLLILLTAGEGPDGTERDAAASAAGALVRERSLRGDACYAILVFPFNRKVPDGISTAVLKMRAEDPERRWGVIPWTADLEVELLDRHSGFPKVDDAVARILTEVPRGAAESIFRGATQPRIGARGMLRVDLGYVPATRMILALTVAYYLWVLLISGQGTAIIGGPDLETLRTWGANHGELTLAYGEQWRLVTYMLLHGGILHLGFNMWALWSLGRHLELLFGPARMFFIYLMGGIGGGIASTVFRAGAVTSVGASGAIMGLLGGLLYFALAMPGKRLDWRAMLGPLGINLIFGFFWRGIDNHAHFGGAIAGFLAAFLVGIAGERMPWRFYAMGVVGILTALVLSGILRLPYLGLF